MEEIGHGKLKAVLTRDPVVTLMFVIAVMLIVLDGASISIVIHTHQVEILKVPMLATGAFAIAGILFGLFRSLRSGGRSA